MMPLIIEAGARAFALSLIVWLVLAATRPRNPHVHKIVWVTLLVASLAMPLLVCVSVAPVVHAPEQVLTLLASRGAPDVGVSVRDTSGWMGVSALYAMIVITLVSRLALGLARMAHVRRTARRIEAPWTRGLDVRASARLSAPVTFGSTILLPEDFALWSEHKLAAVLTHERSHVRWQDCRVLWLARLYACVFWFNPFAWWMQRRLAALAETTSDDAVIIALDDRPAYAEVLLEFAGHPPASRVVLGMARPNLSKRIERIISDIAPPVVPKLRQRIMAVALLLPAVVAAAAPLETRSAHLAQASARGASHIMEQRPGPSIRKWPELPVLQTYYPADAKRAGIEGLVQIRVTLDQQGRPTDTLILDEQPLYVGFGAAASALAHVMEYDNPTRQPIEITFKVKFALEGDRPAPPSSPAQPH